MKMPCLKYGKRALPALICLLMLPACAPTLTTGLSPELNKTTQASGMVTDVSCEAFSKISYACDPVSDAHGRLIDCGAGNDTVDTVQDVRKHNAAWQAICGGQKKEQLLKEVKQ